MKKSNSYSPEVRERAVRMVLENGGLRIQVQHLS
jgi:transposase-like protein